MKNTLPSLKYLAACCLTFYLTIILVLPVAAYEAPRADVAPIIDGVMTDAAWKQAKWQKLDHFILGEATNEEDFSGRFKVVWTPERLFVLALITDDVLLDRTADPLEKYWEDDLFEILLDEDASGGPHHTSYNAFAYHISLDNQIVDIGENGIPRLLNDHVDSRWRRSTQFNNTLVWEASVKVFDDSFSDQASNPKPVTLTHNKTLGFMIAYCDADDPDNGREAFITSHDIDPVDGDRNRAYLDASVFGELVLLDR